VALLTVSDKIAMAGTGQQIEELPKLHTVPYGYYLKRGGEIGRLQADHSFIPHYAAKGHEFLGFEREISREDAEACVWLRAAGTVKKVRKNKKKKLKKGENA
jgi:hypothetical protein